MRHQIWVVIAALAAGYGGGLVSQSHMTVQAQGLGQQNPARILQQGFDTQGNIIVPAQGLAFVDATGRVIARLGGQGPNGYFMVNNGEGQPSVSIVAGTGARLLADTSVPGGSIYVGTVDGSSSAKLAGTVTSPVLELTQSGKPVAQIKAEPNKGATLSLWHSSGQPEFMVGKDKDGPFWQLTSEAGVKLAEVARQPADGASLYLRGSKESLEAWYWSNKFLYKEAGKTTLEFPPKED